MSCSFTDFFIEAFEYSILCSEGSDDYFYFFIEFKMDSFSDSFIVDSALLRPEVLRGVSLIFVII